MVFGFSFLNEKLLLRVFMLISGIFYLFLFITFFPFPKTWLLAAVAAAIAAAIDDDDLVYVDVGEVVLCIHLRRVALLVV